MGTVLGIAGFTLLWAATCLTEASLAEIVLTGLLGLALMIAGRLWTPLHGMDKGEDAPPAYACRHAGAPTAGGTRTDASGTPASGARAPAGSNPRICRKSNAGGNSPRRYRGDECAPAYARRHAGGKRRQRTHAKARRALRRRKKERRWCSNTSRRKGQ